MWCSEVFSACYGNYNRLSFLRRSEVLGVRVSSADQFSCFCSQEMGKDHWKNNFLLPKYIVKRALWEILVYVFLGGCVQVAGHNSGSHRAKTLGLNTGKNNLAPKLVKGKKVQLILTWLKMRVWCQKKKKKVVKFLKLIFQGNVILQKYLTVISLKSYLLYVQLVNILHACSCCRWIAPVPAVLLPCCAASWPWPPFPFL